MAPSFGVNAKFKVRADVCNFFNKLNINPKSIDEFLGSLNPNGTLNAAPNARTKSYRKLWPTLPTVAVLLSAL